MMLGLMFTLITDGSAPVRIENCKIEDDIIVLAWCDFTNIGQTAIAEIRFDGTARDSERTVPWTKPFGQMVYGVGFPGGIEPGETLAYGMRVPKFPDRANIDTLIIETIGLTAYDVNGEPINSPPTPSPAP